MKNILVCFTVLNLLFIASIASCTKDKVAEPEACSEVKPFNGELKSLIRNKCNLSGCHDGSIGVGNYNTYAGILDVLENGAFISQVVVQKAMPKTGSLTEQEFEDLKCWSENGFPEN